jgi:predicted small integral membrane protein
VRLAEAEAARTARQRARERRERRRALLRRLRPVLPDRLPFSGRPRRRRTGRLFARRTRGQRAAVAIVALAALVLVWLGIDSLSTRIALTALIGIATPALTVLAFDRRI